MKKLISILLAAALALTAPAAALASDGPALVTDGYTFQYDYDGYVSDYHVPHIDREGAGVAALNAAMWADLYEGYVAELVYASEYGDYWPSTGGLSYSWTVSGDVLSICAVVLGQTDNDIYYVYNMSLSSGERMSDRELFAAAGVTREQFNELVRAALSASYDEFSQYTDSGVMEASFLEEQRARSTADENIAGAAPYIGPGGALCAVARQYSLAGADYYYHTYTLVPGDMQPQLDYFIEHSDSQVFTRADIEGFDDEMCMYARNGVYARSGRKFQDPDLQRYFEQFSWYVPTVEPADFTPDMLNACQNQNIALVMAYEQEHGYD